MKSPYIVITEEEVQEEKKIQPPNISIILITLSLLLSGYLYMRVQTLERKTTNILAASYQLAKNNAAAAVAPAPTVQLLDITVTATPTAQPLNTVSPTPTPQLIDLIPVVTDKDHIRGNRNAKIVLVEYSDLECPFCKKFHPTMKQVLKEYGDKVAWVYRHYPLPFHPNAQKEAEASECAADQGGNITFWNYIDAILDRTNSGGEGFSLKKLVPLAEELGLDGTKFKTCLDSGTYAQKVKTGVDNAAKGGVTGTPATVTIPSTGKRDVISGALSFEEIKQQLDQILK